MAVFINLPKEVIVPKDHHPKASVLPPKAKGFTFDGPTNPDGVNLWFSGKSGPSGSKFGKNLSKGQKKK